MQGLSRGSVRLQSRHCLLHPRNQIGSVFVPKAIQEQVPPTSTAPLPTYALPRTVQEQADAASSIVKICWSAGHNRQILQMINPINEKVNNILLCMCVCWPNQQWHVKAMIYRLYIYLNKGFLAKAKPPNGEKSFGNMLWDGSLVICNALRSGNILCQYWSHRLPHLQLGGISGPHGPCQKLHVKVRANNSPDHG